MIFKLHRTDGYDLMFFLQKAHLKMVNEYLLNGFIQRRKIHSLYKNSSNIITLYSNVKMAK